jgi:hypothetical protein
MAMSELMRPFERSWEWIDRTGGYPGKLLFVSLILMLIVIAFSWYSNRAAT